MKTNGVLLDTTSLSRKNLATVALALGLSSSDLKREGIPKPENRKQATMLRLRLDRCNVPLR